MFAKILEETKRLIAGDLRHCVAHSIQFAGGDRLVRPEPSFDFPTRSAAGAPPLPPFFDGFVFISELAPNQERELSSSLRQI